jgi:hypothetical protein
MEAHTFCIGIKENTFTCLTGDNKTFWGKEKREKEREREREGEEKNVMLRSEIYHGIYSLQSCCSL